MADVAARAGVSKNTVSLSLRNDPQIPATTRDRIRRIAEEMGYQRNATVAQLMAQLRAGRSKKFEATLALVNANLDRHAFTKHPTIPTYIEGCRRRAALQGYVLDEFWLHDPQMDGDRFNRILRNRGIRGVIVVGLMNENRLPERFQPVWRQFPCVVTGVRTRQPALSFACTDHHLLTLRAVEHLLRLGYRRPALVMDPVIERLVEGRFSAGFLIAQQTLPGVETVAPFHQMAEAERDPAAFRRWLKKEKPDVLLTLYNVVKRWVEDAGLRVPRDIGLVQLEWRKDRPEWAGMNQHNDVTGEAAVDMVISMIHNNECTVPEFPRATLVGNTWVDGKTVRKRRAK
jgi:DNA-binding LacI/PurR family transcriptional regulator